jgi:hypothetical protein
MSVTVDRQPLEAERMGLQTLGQLLAHLQKENRLVVHVLVDGQEPDLTQMPTVRKIPLDRHTLFIETADPRDLALQALAEVESQLDDADRLRAEAGDLILAGQHQQAMGKLSGCFATWQSAPESVLKTAQLLRVDLNELRIDGQPLTAGVTLFAEQLRHIKDALEGRDFVRLNDILTYEAPETTAHWRAAINALRGTIAAAAVH